MTLLRIRIYCMAAHAAAVVLGLCTFGGVPQAGESDQYQRISRDLKTWIDGLTDQAGANCCSNADGAAPDGVDWDIGANHYRVKVEGQWIDVPDTAVVKGPNYLGHAVVWMDKAPQGNADADSYINEFPHIRCFLPGPAI